MSPDDPTAPEGVLASIIANEVAAEPDLPRRRKLGGQLLRLLARDADRTIRPRRRREA